MSFPVGFLHAMASRVDIMNVFIHCGQEPSQPSDPVMTASDVRVRRPDVAAPAAGPRVAPLGEGEAAGAASDPPAPADGQAPRPVPVDGVEDEENCRGLMRG